MLARLRVLWPAVQEVAANRDGLAILDRPTGDDPPHRPYSDFASRRLDVIDAILPLLSLFAAAEADLEGSAYPTVGQAMATFLVMRKQIEARRRIVSDDVRRHDRPGQPPAGPALDRFFDALQAAVSSAFEELDDVDVLAPFVDLRVGGRLFITQTNPPFSTWRQRFVAYAIKVIEANRQAAATGAEAAGGGGGDGDDAAPEPAPKRAKSLSSMAAMRHEMLDEMGRPATVPHHQSLEQELDSELKVWLGLERLEDGGDPVKAAHDLRFRFPLMTEVAKHILVQDVSSAMSERTFSSSALMATPIRNRLSARTLSDLVCVRSQIRAALSMSLVASLSSLAVLAEFEFE